MCAGVRKNGYVAATLDKYTVRLDGPSSCNACSHPPSGGAMPAAAASAAAVEGRRRPSRWLCRFSFIPFRFNLQGLKPFPSKSLDVAAEQAAEKVVYSVIPSEARNLSSI